MDSKVRVVLFNFLCGSYFIEIIVGNYFELYSNCIIVVDGDWIVVDVIRLVWYCWKLVVFLVNEDF